MPDQDPQSGQAPGEQQQPTDDPKPQQQQPPAQQPPKDEPADGEPFDRERALATIRTLRDFEKKSKAQERELEQLRAKVKEADDAKLSEQERLTKRVAELEAETARHAEEKKTLLVRTAVEREARKLNLVDEDAAYRLLDLSQIEYGDDGAPKNVDALLKALAKEKPYLVAQANGKAPISPTPRADDGRAATQAEIEQRRAVLDQRVRRSFG